jgi:hypothetical protein
LYKEIEVSELYDVRKKVVNVFKKHGCDPADIAFICTNLLVNTAEAVEKVQENRGVSLLELCIRKLNEVREKAFPEITEENIKCSSTAIGLSNGKWILQCVVTNQNNELIQCHVGNQLYDTTEEVEKAADFWVSDFAESFEKKGCKNTNIKRER